MAITLGKNGSTPPFGAGIIDVTFSEEVETIDISNRENVGAGYKINDTGFVSRTYEITCHDPTGVVAALEANATTGWTVMGVTENISVDGAVTFTVTAKEA